MGLKQTFTRKNYGTLYKWSVIGGYQANKSGSIVSDAACTGYVYDVVVVNGQIQRLLYVECGYVQ